MENKILYFLILLLCLSCKGYKSNEANNNLQNRICVSYSCDSIIFDKVSTPTQVEFKFFAADTLRETINQSKSICIIDLVKNIKNTKDFGKHSKKCTFYTLRFGCSFAAVNTIKPQLL